MRLVKLRRYSLYITYVSLAVNFIFILILITSFSLPSSSSNANLPTSVLDCSTAAEHKKSRSHHSGDLDAFRKENIAEQIKNFPYPLLYQPRLGKTSVRMNVPFRVWFRNIKLFFCGIPRNSYSHFLALFCASNYPEQNFTRIIRQNPMEVFKENRWFMCNKENMPPHNLNHQSLQYVWNSESWTKLAVIRDPLRRLISSFINVCQVKHMNCHGTNYDIHNFIGANYVEMRKVSQNQTYDFAKEHAPFRHHFWPQSWYCEFENNMDKMTLIRHEKSTTFAESTRKTLAKIGLPDSIVNHGWGEYGVEPFLGMSSYHQSPDSLAENLVATVLNNSKTLEYFLKTYGIDYVYLGYPIPTLHHADRYLAQQN